MILIQKRRNSFSTFHNMKPEICQNHTSVRDAPEVSRMPKSTGIIATGMILKKKTSPELLYVTNVRPTKQDRPKNWLHTERMTVRSTSGTMRGQSLPTSVPFVVPVLTATKISCRITERCIPMLFHAEMTCSVLHVACNLLLSMS